MGIILYQAGSVWLSLLLPSENNSPSLIKLYRGAVAPHRINPFYVCVCMCMCGCLLFLFMWWVILFLVLLCFFCLGFSPILYHLGLVFLLAFDLNHDHKKIVSSLKKKKRECFIRPHRKTYMNACSQGHLQVLQNPDLAKTISWCLESDSLVVLFLLLFSKAHVSPGYCLKRKQGQWEIVLWTLRPTCRSLASV